jgi:hypothetical protein
VKRITNAELKELAKSNLRDGGRLKAMATELLALRRIKTLTADYISAYEANGCDTEHEIEMECDALDALKTALKES